MRSTRANLSSEQRLKEVEAARVHIRSMRVDIRKEKKDFMVDFSTTKLTEQSHFEAFEQNKEVACMLWHINSGFHRLSQLEDLQGEGGKEAMRSLLDDIHSEKLDPDENNAMIEAFLQAQGRGGYSGDCSPFENPKDTNPTVFQTNRLTDCNHTIFLHYIHQIQEHYLSFLLLMYPRLPLFQRVLHLIVCLQILILTRCHARLLSTVESISLKETWNKSNMYEIFIIVGHYRTHTHTHTRY
jgi:hypothetical protein